MIIKGEFKKNVVVLMTGSIFAQVIPTLVSPILTRIYTPEEFGQLGVYIAICSLLSVFACWRLDTAIIEPKEDAEAKNLLMGAIILSILFLAFLYIILILFNGTITSLLSHTKIFNWLYAIPIAIFTLSCLSIFSHWLNREKRYKELTINRILGSSSNGVISLLYPLSGLNYGLVVAYIFSQIITVSIFWKRIFNFNFEISFHSIYRTILKYSHYPKYLIPATLASEVSSQMPIILLTSLYSPATAGYFSLMNKVTIVPLSLIGNSVGEVYRQKAVEEYHLYGNCKRIFVKTIISLMFIGIVPLIILLIFSEPLFIFFFGEKWAIAGKMANITAVLVFFQLISTPLSYTIVLNRSQKYDLLLQIGRVILSGSSIFIGYYMSDFYLGIVLYTISYCIYYISHSILQYIASSGYVFGTKI